MTFRTALLALTCAATSAAAQQPTRPAARPAGQPAQASAPTRVAYLNSAAILNQTPGYAAAESTFAREMQASRDEITRMQAAFDSAASEFESSSVLLSPTAKADKQRQLVEQQRGLQRRQEELQARMQQKERELLDPLQQRVQAVVEGIRAEQNLAMVFDVSAMGGALVAADRSLDITPLVIQRLQGSAGH
ncbi:MAG TPA: OmpH family outer membrane protein [Gemmatimonadales bacterium]|nr:OmpH family outer membrane protein [Gemmatimonadales bacterium]